MSRDDASTPPAAAWPLQRRDVLRLGGGVAGAALLSGCDGGADDPNPRVTGTVWRTPVERVAPSLCRQCQGGCGLRLRIRDDTDLVGLSGLPDHPVNQGRVCARAYGLLSLYASPHRLRTPLLRPDKDAPLTGTDWDTALNVLADRLGALQAAGRAAEIVVLGPFHRGLRRALLERWAHGLGGARVLPFASAVPVQPAYALDQASLVLSLGAELFEDWLNPVYAMGAYGRFRGPEGGRPGRLIHIGARRSRTAALADLYVPVPPGQEGRLALGVADLVETAGPRGAVALTAVAALAGRVGVDPRAVAALVAALRGPDPGLSLAPATHPALVPAEAETAAKRWNRLFARRSGRAPLVGRHAAALPGLEEDGTAFTAPPGDPVRSLLQALAGRAGERVALVILVEAEPLRRHPLGQALADALTRVPMVVSTAGWVRDAGPYADLILPDALPPERWVDDPVTFLPDRVAVSLMPPAVSVDPDGGPRDSLDLLLRLGRRLGGKAALPWGTYGTFAQETYGEAGVSVESGVWSTPSSYGPKPLGAAVSVPRGEAGPHESSAAGDPSALRLKLFRPGLQPEAGAAGQPALQEHRAGPALAPYRMWASMHPDDAHGRRLTEGQKVRLVTPHGSLEAVLCLSDTTQTGVLEVPVLAEDTPNAWCLIETGQGDIEPERSRRVRVVPV